MEGGKESNTTVYISSKSHLNLTFNLLKCGVYETSPLNVTSLAAEDCFHLMILREGSALLETGGLGFKLAPGQGFFTFPDADYDLKNLADDTLSVVWLSFTGYQVENYLNRANIFRTRPVFQDPEGHVGRQMERIFTASQRLPNRYCRMASILYDIVSHLLDLNPTKGSDKYVDNANFFAARAVDYIEHGYAANVTVEDIAEALGISRKHLYAVFNEVLKISPKQYLIYYRVEKACMRLKSTAQSVAEIAESVGYSNQFYFAKEFKRLTGMTPSEYRKDPSHSQIFSYHSFAGTLREHIGSGDALQLPVREEILSVFTPPLTQSSRNRKEP